MYKYFLTHGNKSNKINYSLCGISQKSFACRPAGCNSYQSFAIGPAPIFIALRHRFRIGRCTALQILHRLRQQVFARSLLTLATPL